MDACYSQLLSLQVSSGLASLLRPVPGSYVPWTPDLGDERPFVEIKLSNADHETTYVEFLEFETLKNVRVIHLTESEQDGAATSKEIQVRDVRFMSEKQGHDKTLAVQRLHFSDTGDPYEIFCSRIHFKH